MIRIARSDDIDPLLAIEERCFAADRLSRGAFRRYLAHPGKRILCTVDGVLPVGYALVFFRKNSRSCRLYSLAVLPEYRNRGLARELMDAVYDELRRRGLTRLLLEVRPDNFSAIRFYERDGFRRFGAYEHFYEDGSAALRMEKLF